MGLSEKQKYALTSLQQKLFYQNNNNDPYDDGPSAREVSRQLEELIDILLGSKYRAPWERAFD